MVREARASLAGKTWVRPAAGPGASSRSESADPRLRLDPLQQSPQLRTPRAWDPHGRAGSDLVASDGFNAVEGTRRRTTSVEAKNVALPPPPHAQYGCFSARAPREGKRDNGGRPDRWLHNAGPDGNKAEELHRIARELDALAGSMAERAVELEGIVSRGATLQGEFAVCQAEVSQLRQQVASLEREEAPDRRASARPPEKPQWEQQPAERFLPAESAGGKHRLLVGSDGQPGENLDYLRNALGLDGISEGEFARRRA